MTAAEIAGGLGDASREGRNWRCVCPVHGGRSLALRDGRRGLLVTCWAGCGSNEVLAELRRLGLLAGRSERTPPAPMPARSDERAEAERRIALARRIWDAARDAHASPVAHYLVSRGITIPMPLSLRWARACRHPSGIELPAMIARIDNIDGELIGIHRTFLRPDGGGKADAEPSKAMIGRAAGSAVRLVAAAETLIVGEGIESTLSAMQATGLPAWAALSVSGLIALVLPPTAQNVIIIADNDANGVGQRAAKAAAQRWRREGRRVSVWMSPQIGTDANDLLPATMNARNAA
jgi:phage/plasmid primase-like uncharacterized protein